MFDSTKNSLSGRIADAVDLLIDFATLGEYGLEPVEVARECHGRRRNARPGGRRRAGSGRPVVQRSR